MIEVCVWGGEGGGGRERRWKEVERRRVTARWCCYSVAHFGENSILLLREVGRMKVQ